jgi:plasmid stabilization system protein ParE
MTSKQYDIVLTSIFWDDLDKIIAFYKNRSNAYADRLFYKIKELLNSLKTYPERFATIPDILPTEKLNLRQCVCDNYRIIYQIKDNHVYILTILGQNLLDTDKLGI